MGGGNLNHHMIVSYSDHLKCACKQAHFWRLLGSQQSRGDCVLHGFSNWTKSDWIWMCVTFVLLMKSWGKSAESVKSKFWKHTAWHFSGISPISPAFACVRLSGGYKINLVIRLVSAVSQPADSAGHTLLLFLEHTKLKHLPGPLFGINVPKWWNMTFNWLYSNCTSQ